MPSDILLPIYDYASTAPAKTLDALSTLVGEKTRVLGLGISAATKILAHAEKIVSEFRTKDQSKILTQLDLATLGYLDKEIVEAFIQDPGNSEIRNILTVKLLFVSAATGLLDEAEIFSPDELEKMDQADNLSDLSLDEDLFQKISYAKTVRYIMVADDGVDYLTHLRRQVATAYYDQSQMTYDREGAFLYGLILRAAWSVFHLFSTEDRQLLLESSIYCGIVSGTPLAAILSVFFSTRIPRDERERLNYIQFYWNFANGNQEIVPLNIAEVKGKKLNEIVLNYIAAARTDSVDGFAQKKFIDDLYLDQPGRDPYGRWLREATAVILHLKKGDWIPEVKS